MDHWEGDTVIGAANKQALVTLVDRKRYLPGQKKIYLEPAGLCCYSMRLADWTSYCPGLLDHAASFEHQIHAIDLLNGQESMCSSAGLCLFSLFDAQ